MKRSFPLILGVAGALVALDQWSKQQATAHLAYHEPVRVLGDLVRLTYARNSGIAFSLFAGRGFPLWIFSLVAAVAVLVLSARHARLPLGRQLALALIMGGAVGNLIDRVTTGLVVDFILLSWGRHEFPVFNVADIAVTCGVALFALTWTHEDKPDEAGSNEQDAGPDRSGPGSGPEAGSLAGQGADRPVA